MKKKMHLAATLLVFGAAVASEEFELRELLDGKITMQLPTEFTTMSDEVRKVKYPGANAPSVVMTDATTTVNVALDHKPVNITPAQVKDLEPALRQQLASARINSGGLQTLNGHEFLVMDFDTPAQDGIIRNVMAMTSLDDRLLVVSYNCMLNRHPDCGALGTQLIESIRVKD